MSNLVPSSKSSMSRTAHVDSIARRVQFTIYSGGTFVAAIVAAFLIPGLPIIDNVADLAVVASGAATAGGAGATVLGMRRAKNRYRR